MAISAEVESEFSGRGSRSSNSGRRFPVNGVGDKGFSSGPVGAIGFFQAIDLSDLFVPPLFSSFTSGGGQVVIINLPAPSRVW
jgi:hypothetical protein